MGNPAELQEKLKRLSEAYAAQLPDKLKNIAQAWAVLPQTQWNDEAFQILYRSVHSLSGSGKTFGFAELSNAAHILERCLKPFGEAKQALNSAQREEVSRLIGVLHQSAKGQDSPSNAAPVVGVQGNTVASRRIYVIEDDHVLAEELKTQLSYFGYQVSAFHTLNDFKQAMQQNSDVIVLMDINSPEDAMGGIHVMSDLQQGRATPIPVLFFSAENDMQYRLETVRAGGVAYLNKPVNLGVLIDKLDELTSTQVASAYRVLIVDDDIALSNYYAAVLNQAGMRVTVVNDPLNVMKPLLEFTPDLLLIDMYMPEYNGMELARSIRQIDAFVGVPIVFLSAETNLDKQLEAMGLGGDDFLSKPIQSQHLISAVNSRIRRSLILRSFMVRDSLTGLLNHTAIKDQLSREMAMAKRHDKPLTFAMVDIDFFKKVNDTYGHPVGDRVIKSLSRLLKQRLRETDIVGRYGGEEFAVVLVDADGPTAMKVLDSIRYDFSQLLHLAGDQEFSVSFSCGIAENAQFGDASKMADAADRALYKAKHAGRNQIVLADAAPSDQNNALTRCA